MTSTRDKNRDARLRRLANRHGLALRKSRLRGTPHADDFGGYRIIDPYRNAIVRGERFDLDLDDVEEYLTAEN